MVIALADLQGLEIRVQVLADRFRVDEIHRRSGDRFGVAQRDLGRVGRKVFGSVEG